MRFLHCGDIHIGAGRADGREKDFADAFSAIARLAVEEKVDVCLIAGDLFDRREINPRALNEAVEGLVMLKRAGIPVYAIEGNHDKALYVDRDSWMDYLNAQGMLRLLKRPVGDVLFTPYGEGGNTDVVCGVRIVGLPYAGTRTRELVEAMTEEFPDFDGPTIVMLHCPVSGQMAIDNAYLPSSVVDALAEKVDYIALGHIHTAYSYGGVAYNPGSPESVRLDEAIGKEKGVYLGELNSDGSHHVELIPVHRRSSVWIELTFTEEDTPESVAEKAIAAVSEACDEDGILLCLSLLGQVRFDPSLVDLGAIRTAAREMGVCALDLQMRVTANRRMAASNTMDMAALERQVISELWQGKGYEALRMTEMTLQVKERILGGGEGAAQEIAADLERFCEESQL